MFEGKTDQAWEYFGKNDPYFGVLTWDVFKKGVLTTEAKQEFFATGERHIESVFQTVRDHFDPGFRPSRAMDFGCGVGRLVIPLAMRCDCVVGVDVSESMLETARENAKEIGVGNVTFVQSDDALTKVTGTFDFIHSFIVFQHIPPKRGLEILRRQVGMLKDNGIGALHFTYSYAGTVGAFQRLLTAARQRVPSINMLANLVKRKPLHEPTMQMNEYDVNRLLLILQESGCHQVHLRFNETSVRRNGFYGVTLFFQKRPLP